jgi:hypothetical protein
MLEAIRKFLDSSAGKAVAGIVVVVGLVIAFYSLRGLTASEGEEASSKRMFIDAETMQSFRYTVAPGTKIPVKAPSGKETGYPADACTWTKDGKVKAEPTWVMVNDWLGKKEPTFCPDCGRLVVGHNPPAAEGMTPPPTKEEYAKNPRRSERR